MSRHLSREAVAKAAVVHEELLEPVQVDRTFALPRRLYAVTVALYLGFLAVLAIGMPSSGLTIPIAACLFLVAAGFGVPTLWTRMKPPSKVRAMEWSRFRQHGIVTMTGRLTAGEASTQMLVLPVLIFAWAIICVTIAALV